MLQVIFLFFVILSVVLWILSLILWFIEKPGYEPVNVALGALVTTTISLFSWSRKGSQDLEPIATGDTGNKLIATAGQADEIRQIQGVGTYIENYVNTPTSDDNSRPQSRIEIDSVEGIETIDEAPTVFFHERICDAYPGISGYKWIDNPYEAIERLSRLLKHPTSFDEASGHGVVTDPIWWFRDVSAMPIEHFSRIDATHCLLNRNELNIARIAIVRGHGYWRDFVYVEAAADPPTGLYDHQDATYIREAVRKDGYCEENYGVLNGTYITADEYYEGRAEINGQFVDAQSAELRRRYLSPYNLVISSKYSPYNSPEFEDITLTILNPLLRKEIEFQDFLDVISTLPRHRYDMF